MTLTATTPSLPEGRARAAGSYRAAVRHTRLVKFMRAAIPLGALASFSAFILFPLFNPFRNAGIAVGAVKLDGTRVTMENPRLTGHRGRENQPYEVTAQSATQDIRRPNVIDMVNMSARMVSSNDSVIHLTARYTVFDSTREQMSLREDVRVRTQSGQEAMLRSADVDFKAGTVRSLEPVIVRFPDMGVTADSLDISDSGGQIAFIGRVSAVIDDKDSKAAAAQPGQPSAARPASSGLRPTQGAGRETGQAQPAPSQPVIAQPAAAPPGPPPPRDARGVTIIDPASGRALPAR
jgi:lipopolysaccharide export system protein LptC